MGRTSETRHKPHLPQGSGRQRAATAGTDVQRERILAAAARLFAAQGYANTTLAQIARDLGATKPFVYYYFRDKQEIFETLSWRPAVDCFTALDFAHNDARSACEQVIAGVEGLIRATVAHQPVAFFPYREPQVYRPEYQTAVKALANHFYDKLCPLLEQARRDGDLDFEDTKLTALAALSLPGFLYSWYRPDGRLSADAVAARLTELAMRVLGLRRPLDAAASKPKRAGRSLGRDADVEAGRDADAHVDLHAGLHAGRQASPPADLGAVSPATRSISRPTTTRRPSS